MKTSKAQLHNNRNFTRSYNDDRNLKYCFWKIGVGLNDAIIVIQRFEIRALLPARRIKTTPCIFSANINEGSVKQASVVNVMRSGNRNQWFAAAA